MVRFLKNAIFAAAGGGLLIVAWIAWQCRNLPSEGDVARELCARLSSKGNSRWTPLWAISPKLQTAVVLWEDPTFYSHHGLAYEEIGRAFLTDLRSGHYVRGGSTISQQLVKNVFLSPEKTLRRKVREAVLARRLERELNKNQILEVYFNIADWGDGVVGAEAASHFYFDKSARDLDWPEAALLAAMLCNPHRFNPSKEPQRVLLLREAVLIQLREDLDIGERDFQEALAEPLTPATSLAAKDVSLRRLEAKSGSEADLEVQRASTLSRCLCRH